MTVSFLGQGRLPLNQLVLKSSSYTFTVILIALRTNVAFSKPLSDTT